MRETTVGIRRVPSVDFALFAVYFCEYIMGNFSTQYLKNLMDEALASSTDITSDGCIPPQLAGLGTPTPTVRSQILPLDPRSPTDGICRTPIEVLSLSSKQRAIPEDHSSSLPGQHTPLACSNKPDKYSLLMTDPRSPSLGFIRTPIQLQDMTDSEEESVNDYEISNPQDAATDVEPLEERLTEETRQVSREVLILHSEPIIKENQEAQTPTKLQPTTPPMVKTECKPASSVDSLEEVFLKKNLSKTPKKKDNVHCDTDKENGSTIKSQIFHTPEDKTGGVLKRKVRTPLSTVSSSNSPTQILRVKQSSAINKALAARVADSPQHIRTINP